MGSPDMGAAAARTLKAHHEQVSALIPELILQLYIVTWLAFYHCWTPRPVSLATLVRVAGRRWPIEERFQTGKGLVGLDQHQVRRWRSWYRWTTLAMLAHAFLVVAAVTERTCHPPPAGLISLTCNEVQHLFATLLARPLVTPRHRLRWSLWRRRHQARARTCHYQRQAARP